MDQTRRCWGRTSSLRRCGRYIEGRRYCEDHRWQLARWLAGIAGSILLAVAVQLAFSKDDEILERQQEQTEALRDLKRRSEEGSLEAEVARRFDLGYAMLYFHADGRTFAPNTPVVIDWAQLRCLGVDRETRKLVFRLPDMSMKANPNIRFRSGLARVRPVKGSHVGLIGTHEFRVLFEIVAVEKEALSAVIGVMSKKPTPEPEQTPD